MYILGLLHDYKAFKLISTEIYMESKTNRTIKKYLEKYTTDSNPDPDGKIIPDPVQLSESGTIIPDPDPTWPKSFGPDPSRFWIHYGTLSYLKHVKHNGTKYLHLLVCTFQINKNIY